MSETRDSEPGGFALLLHLIAGREEAARLRSQGRHQEATEMDEAVEEGVRELRRQRKAVIG